MTDQKITAQLTRAAQLEIKMATETQQNAGAPLTEAQPRVERVVMRSSGYRVVSNDYIESLFEGTKFGNPIDTSIEAKRMLIAKTLRNQIDGYWSGHTIYWIVVNGGFLKDAKTTKPKVLTALGHVYLADFGGA